MVVLKTYRELFYDLFFGNADLRMISQLLLMAVPWLFFQLMMLKKCRRWFLRILPLVLLLACILVGEIMTISASGWDGLGWAILTNYFAYGLLGDLIGTVCWAIGQKMKK